MGIVIRDIDHGFKKLKAIKGATVMVGLVGPRGEAIHARFHGTVVELGILHEYGGGHVPARPFLGTTFDENRSTYLAMLKARSGEVFAEGAGNRGLVGGAARYLLAFGGALGLDVPGEEQLGEFGMEASVSHSAGAPTAKALAVVGKRMAEDIVRRIRSHLSPPLKPGTVQAKQRSGAEYPDMPLVDAQQLIRAIGYQITESGKPLAAVYVEG